MEFVRKALTRGPADKSFFTLLSNHINDCDTHTYNTNRVASICFAFQNTTHPPTFVRVASFFKHRFTIPKTVILV